MKKTIIALSIMPGLCFAITDKEKEAVLQSNYKVLESKGLPTPNGGSLQVVDSEQITMPEWQKQKNASVNAEMKKNGYVHESSSRAYELIHIKEKIEKSKSTEKYMFKPNESHLRATSNDISFAYSYAEIPPITYKQLHGVAPVGTYIQDGDEKGWTGAVSFFNTDFAECAYTENNLLASKGVARVSRDESTDDINGKITFVDIVGNKSTGYLYRVNWFDNVFNRSLECATPVYSKDFTTQTIELAKIIDKK